MNKKELSDLRKNFSTDCGFFTFNQVLRAFIDADKNVVYKDHRLFGTLEPEDMELIEVSLKKGLGGTLGKNIAEYTFPKEAYNEVMQHPVLMSALKDKFMTDELNDRFLKHITDNIVYVSTFAVFAVHCTYTLFKRNKNDEKIEDNSDYNFILVVFCPVETADDVLIFDDNSNNIYKRPKNDRLISRNPSDAFLFPVLTGGDPDVNGVLYYTSKPKEPNKSIIEDILGCEQTFTPTGEKEAFCKVLDKVVGDELDYSLITKVNDIITDEIKEHRFDEKPASIDDVKLRDILYDAGIAQKKLEKVHQAFTDTVGDKPLTASNLVSTKTVIATPDITVNIGKNATDKVRTSVIGGRRCLVIDLDDPNIVINGLNTTLELPQAQPAPQEAAAKISETASETTESDTDDIEL